MTGQDSARDAPIVVTERWIAEGERRAHHNVRRASARRGGYRRSMPDTHVRDAEVCIARVERNEDEFSAGVCA